jgi:hypothetical protein
MSVSKKIRPAYDTDHGMLITLETVIGSVMPDDTADKSITEVAMGMIGKDVIERITDSGQEFTYHVTDLTIIVRS